LTIRILLAELAALRDERKRLGIASGTSPSALS